MIRQQTIDMWQVAGGPFVQHDIDRHLIDFIVAGQILRKKTNNEDSISLAMSSEAIQSLSSKIRKIKMALGIVIRWCSPIAIMIGAGNETYFMFKGYHKTKWGILMCILNIPIALERKRTGCFEFIGLIGIYVFLAVCLTHRLKEEQRHVINNISSDAHGLTRSVALILGLNRDICSHVNFILISCFSLFLIHAILTLALGNQSMIATVTVLTAFAVSICLINALFIPSVAFKRHANKARDALYSRAFIISSELSRVQAAKIGLSR